jgi:hypothetical protein
VDLDEIVEIIIGEETKNKFCEKVWLVELMGGYKSSSIDCLQI